MLSYAQLVCTVFVESAYRHKVPNCRINFRVSERQPEECWALAMALSEKLKLDKPCKDTKFGEATGDYGGSHVEALTDYGARAS